MIQYKIYVLSHYIVQILIYFLADFEIPLRFNNFIRIQISRENIIFKIALNKLSSTFLRSDAFMAVLKLFLRSRFL